MKKLIAIDLDGTTLNQDSIITDKTAKTLRRAIEDGLIDSSLKTFCDTT